ncbi:MAG: FecR domain-containing protein [Polyangiaceae bacterium]
MRTDCDRLWEIDALREGTLSAKDTEAFERHARTCDVCAATIARDSRLRKLAIDLPTREPNDLDMRRLRARVLHEVATGAPARRTAHARLAVAMAVGLLAVVSWALVRPRLHPTETLASKATTVSSSTAPPANPTASGFASEILRADGARWSRTRDGLVERVRLVHGTLKIHVRHQTGAERFLVDLPDGELEVRGTTFEVSVDETATERVSVEDGTVALRIAGLTQVELNGGETWTKPKGAEPAKAPAHDAPSVAAPDRAKLKPAAAAAAPSASAQASTDDGADAYAAAIALLQGGKHSAAADAFRAYVLAHPRAPQAEDASFLEAAALARAGRPDAAALAAEDHLARFPKSFHRREAAILIARAARDRGDCEQARAVLAPWLGNPPDDEARATLQKCAAPDGPDRK